MASMFVRCRECGEDHKADAVKFLNIEEDYMGRDLLHYVCPNTGTSTSSNVYRSAPSSEYDCF